MSDWANVVVPSAEGRRDNTGTAPTKAGYAEQRAELLAAIDARRVHGEETFTMTEHERRCRQAAEALHVMRGNGVIDLPRLERILDPDREYGHD